MGCDDGRVDSVRTKLIDYRFGSPRGIATDEARPILVLSLRGAP